MTDLVNIEHVGNRQRGSRSCLVHPVDRFDSEGWFSCNQVKHAAFKWKDAIFGLPVSPGSAEAQVNVRWEVTFWLPTFLVALSPKNYRNRAMYVKIIATQRLDVLRHCVYAVSAAFRCGSCWGAMRDNMMLQGLSSLCINAQSLYKILCSTGSHFSSLNAGFTR